MIKHIRETLKSAGIEHPDREARWILKSVLNISDADLITGDFSVPDPQKQKIDSMVSRRAGGEPLSRIFGEREFRGLNFKIGPGTLDPRPDTEILVNAAVEKFHVKQKTAEILDLGTGSGCVLISLLKELPYASGIGIDLSFEACKISFHNAKSLLGERDAAARARFVCGSWGEALGAERSAAGEAGQAAEAGKFDLIVSNPPYIRRADIPNLDQEVRNHDPILALDGGPDGLEAYKKIFSDLPRLLKKDGTAFFEIGFDQETDIMRLAKDSRIRVERIHPDTAGRPRVVEISCGDK